jgi:competence protein ComEC
MISLVAVGKAMKRQPDILNILAASFIILIIREPTLLMNVGFELSYLAVAGIVLLYKPVYNLYITSNTIVDKIWSIVAVSIAAQMITFPLSLYYFHQFPNYFMVTNILVVPLSTLIIYCGILLLILGSVPFVSFYMAKILIALVWLLNSSIHFIEGWPFAVTRGLYINFEQTICIYLILLTLILFFIFNKKMFLFLMLLFSIGITGSIFYHKVHQLRSKNIILYGMRDLPAFDFVSGKTNFLLSDPKLSDNVYFDERLKENNSATGIKNTLRLTISPGKKNSSGFKLHNCFYKRGNFIQFYNKRLYFLDKSFLSEIKSKIHVDYLIITGNPKVTIEQIRKVFIAEAIIADPSNSPWRSKAWKEEAVKKRIPFHDVNETGVFTIEL